MDTEGQLIKEILRQNEFLLRRHLVLSKTVLDQLKAHGLLTEIARRKILVEPSHKQIGVLIRTMEYKGLNSMKKFLDVLRQTGHSWLVDNILDTDISMNRMQSKTTDSLRYRDRDEVLASATKTGLEYRRALRKSYEPLALYREPRSLTAGVASYFDDDVNKGTSLASLLREREPRGMDPALLPRGHINARTFLTDPTVHHPPLYPELNAYPQGPQAHAATAANIPYPRAKDDIPSTLYGLNQAFADQDQKNQQVMNVLRQEEVAIRQLMDQNARDQSQVRQKQQVVHDIVHRLRDIHVRANEVYKPSPHPNVGRYRLSQLNQIPWSIHQ